MNERSRYAEESLRRRRATLERLLQTSAAPALRSELDEIDAALGRLRTGGWGRCERCGRAVGWQRLRALPETRHCLECSTGFSSPEPG